ncbi:unnamed protein product, partial [Ectocarpus sp. 8 AP-2014]
VPSVPPAPTAHNDTHPPLSATPLHQPSTVRRENIMMNFGKMPAGRTASRLARVVGKSEASIQSSVRAGSMNALLSTRSGLTVTQAATRLAIAKLPVRHMSGQVR